MISVLTISNVSTVAFSGSRVLPDNAPIFDACLAAIASGADRFLIGDAKGVDAATADCLRSLGIDPEIFSASDYGKGRSSFARRSIAVVDQVASQGGAWISIAGSACPEGLLPSHSSSRAFSGKGSGTWASLAYAIGKGCDCYLWCIDAPPSEWGMTPHGDGGDWWTLKGHHQASLF